MVPAYDHSSPAGAPLTERWVWQGSKVAIRPFAEVELELIERNPDPPHTEDWLVNPVYYRLVRALSPDKRMSLLQKIEDSSVASIFGAPIRHDRGWFVDAGSGKRSLGTVRAKVERVALSLRPDSKWDYRITLRDGEGAEYRLAVTDLAFRYYLDHVLESENLSPEKAAERMSALLGATTVYLRIGLARGWDKYPERCHLQITGVYSFSDYLDGRCFADFPPRSNSVPAVVNAPF